MGREGGGWKERVVVRRMKEGRGRGEGMKGVGNGGGRGVGGWVRMKGGREKEVTNYIPSHLHTPSSLSSCTSSSAVH